MNRIKSCFERLKLQNKKGLIPYITAGDPSPDITVKLMHAMAEQGADIIELGIPFSDPVADGPVIEKAHHRAVKQNVTLKVVMDIVATFRKKDITTPVVLMTYLNPIEVTGYEKFANLSLSVGVDGVLIVDCPPEESTDIHGLLLQQNIDMIYLISPNTKDERIKNICSYASGYIYYVSIKGITGSPQKLEINQIAEKINNIKRFTSLPVCVGFGVRDGETARLLAETADAVIMGTTIVNTIYNSSNDNVCKNISNQIKNIYNHMLR